MAKLPADTEGSPLKRIWSSIGEHAKIAVAIVGVCSILISILTYTSGWVGYSIDWIKSISNTIDSVKFIQNTLISLDDHNKKTDERLNRLEHERQGEIAGPTQQSVSPNIQIAEIRHELDSIKAAQEQVGSTNSSFLTRLAALEGRIKTLESASISARATPASVTNIVEKCNSRELWKDLKACLRSCIREENNIACAVTFINMGAEKYFRFGKSDDRSAPTATIHTSRSNNYNSNFILVGDKAANGSVHIIDNASIIVTYNFDVPSRSDNHIEIMEIPMWYASAPPMQPIDVPIRVSDIDITQ